MERSKSSITVRMKHEDDCGMNEDSNLSRSGPWANAVCNRVSKELCNRRGQH